MKLAYFSPLSPVRSGIAAYSEELLPYLAERAQIDLFVDDYVPTHPAIVERFAIYPHLAYGANRGAYDAAVYHLGNHYCHAGIYRTFLEYPGIVVLHDFNLYGLIGWMTLEQQDRVGFVREMGYAEDLAGSQRAWRIVNGYEAVLSSDHPLNRRALDLSLGAIVHSDHARRSIQQHSPATPVAKIEMGVPSSPAPSAEVRAQARRALGLAADDLLIASFGLMTPEKRVASVLRALAELLQAHPQARYTLVGEAAPGYDPLETARELGLEERVDLTGYLPFAEYRAYMVASDIAINLRYPTAGETSASVLRLLGAGLPTLVSDVGWFAELPDDCCRKVPPGAGEQKIILERLLELAGDGALRRRLGEQARDYVHSQHSLAGAAQAYISFIQEVLQQLG